MSSYIQTFIIKGHDYKCVLSIEGFKGQSNFHPYNFNPSIYITLKKIMDNATFECLRLPQSYQGDQTPTSSGSAEPI